MSSHDASYLIILYPATMNEANDVSMSFDDDDAQQQLLSSPKSSSPHNTRETAFVIDGSGDEGGTKPSAAAAAGSSSSSSSSSYNPATGKKPTRNRGAYFLFSDAKTEELKTTRPNLKPLEISMLVSNQFRELSEDERKVWDVRAEEDKARYEKELAAYNSYQLLGGRKPSPSKQSGNYARKVSMSPPTINGSSADSSATSNKPFGCRHCSERFDNIRASRRHEKKCKKKQKKVKAEKKVKGEEKLSAESDGNEKEEAEDVEEAEEITYTSYRPMKLNFGKDHPDPVVENSTLSAVAPPDVTYNLAMPASILSEGKLSNLQLEAIVYGCQRHLVDLPVKPADMNEMMEGQDMTEESPMRAGFLLGDGAGMGKGRTLAGFVVENIARGRNKHVWVSVSSDLYEGKFSVSFDRMRVHHVSVYISTPFSFAT